MTTNRRRRTIFGSLPNFLVAFFANSEEIPIFPARFFAPISTMYGGNSTLDSEAQVAHPRR